MCVFSGNKTACMVLSDWVTYVAQTFSTAEMSSFVWILAMNVYIAKPFNLILELMVIHKLELHPFVFGNTECV